MQYVCINFLGFFVEGYCNTFHTSRADCNTRLRQHRTSTLSLPPHAPCRLQHSSRNSTLWEVCFASTRSVQIATGKERRESVSHNLCLHTLRADCNCASTKRCASSIALPPHAPCRLQPRRGAGTQESNLLCLHTLRADCNRENGGGTLMTDPLPPHAPCRLQRNGEHAVGGTLIFASTRSVQIATLFVRHGVVFRLILCLHTLRADCNRAAPPSPA